MSTSESPAIEKIQSVRGMNDMLPDEAPLWRRLEEAVRSVMARYGYGEIRTPILERTALFARSLGAATDVVEKEMFSFTDRPDAAGGGEALCLRPENTAGVVRAALEHHLLRQGGARLFYYGPMFRHERPQRGRLRQFHQAGAEALGFAATPALDIEQILMTRAIWHELGLGNLALHVNCLGQPEERAQYREALVAYLQEHEAALDEDSRRRLTTNPLRILDSKNPQMQEVLAGAPLLSHFLQTDSQRFFLAMTDALEALRIHYVFNERLVRGLDYYNLGVFEWVSDELGAQSAVCGGGRYDGLAEQLGGENAAAVGWALGCERVLELLRQKTSAAPSACDAYAIILPHPHETAGYALALAAIEALRQQGVRVLMHPGPGSMKAQMRRADSSGANAALIFGGEELAQGGCSVKWLRNEGAAQEIVPLHEITKLVQPLLAPAA